MRMRVAIGVAAGCLVAGAVLVTSPPPVAASPACLPSVTGAAELNTHFASPGLGARPDQEGFGGGDYPRSYPLPDGRVLWLFQDLHFSNDETLGATNAAHNAGLIQSGQCFTILGGRGLDFAGGAPLTVHSRRWFWALDGEIGRDGKLWIFFAEMENPSGAGAGVGTVPTGTWLARIDPTSLVVESFERAPDSGARLYGWSVASDDRWSYLFAHCYRQFANGDGELAGFDASCMQHAYVARVPLGDFTATPEHWTGSGWSVDGTPMPISSRGVANPMSVQWFGDQWVSVTKLDDWWGSSLIIDAAPAPQGPWETVHTQHVSGDRRCSECGNYGASLLPWLDANAKMTVSLSNGAPFHLWRANAWLYRPSFYTFDVPISTVPLAATAPPGFPVPPGTAGLVAVDPLRLVDTRDPQQPPRLSAEGTLRIDVGDLAPPGTTAVALNLTSVASDDGFIAAHACSSPRPATSNLNPAAGRVVTNAAIVPIGDGELCFYSHAATELLVDLNGWLTTTSDVGLHPVDTRRLVDTRSGLGGSTRLPAGATVAIPVVPVGSATTAVQLNLTAVEPRTDGFVTAWPCGTDRPTVSNLNPVAGVTRPNLVNVRVGDGGTVCLYTEQETDLLVDLLAEYRPGAPARFAAIDPVRVVDTRGGSRPTHAARSVVVALGRTVAVQANVTATNTAAPGFLTVYPCFTDPLPSTSNVNYAAAESTANSTSMRPGRGYGCVWASDPADVIVDVFGVWS